MTFWEEQMNHEPTRLYHEKLKEIVEHYIRMNIWPSLQKLEVLEIGLDVGISAKTFLEFPNIKLTSVDSGIVEIGIREIETLDTGRWSFYPTSSDKYFANFANCKKEYDIIFVDGDHSYTQTKKDIDNAWKFIKEGGILLGHDFLHKSNFTNNIDCGVTQAFREFLVEKNVNAEVYPPDPGIILIRK